MAPTITAAPYEDLHAHANSLINAINTAEHDWMAAQQRMTQLGTPLPKEGTEPVQEIAETIAKVFERHEYLDARLNELKRFGTGGGYELRQPEYDRVCHNVCWLHEHGMEGHYNEMLEKVETAEADLNALDEALSALEKNVTEGFIGLRKQFARIVEELVYELGESEDELIGADDEASQYVAAFYAELRAYATHVPGVRRAVKNMLRELERDMKELGILAGVTHA